MSSPASMTVHRTTPTIVLIVFGARAGGESSWPLGPTLFARTTRDLARVCDDMPDCEGVLFWDQSLGAPESDSVLEAWSRPGDVWHLGLQLGMAGQPDVLRSVLPTWMLSRDPDPFAEASSWRLSLRACLIRRQILERFGGPDGDFQTLAGASLELGFRLVRGGALVRNQPLLSRARTSMPHEILPMEDEVRFLSRTVGIKWTLWALLREASRGRVSHAISGLVFLWNRVQPGASALEPVRAQPTDTYPGVLDGRVSVVIPTLDRYDFLLQVLDQLKLQTVPPYEVWIVDQSELERRNDLAELFPSLPIRQLELDPPGQCRARNLALRHLTGDFVLFIDDDDEIEPDLIERHLGHLEAYELDVSCGVAHETGSQLPEDFLHARLSDVFPTNNSMVRRSALLASGMFDLAYDHGARADADLGMRLYLSGALMRMDPSISVVHHHAPRGGLRSHRARVHTYASSRLRLRTKHLPSETELYLALRYFEPPNARERLLHAAFGTLITHQRRWDSRIAKSIYGSLTMPSTLWTLWRSLSQARRLLERFPQIPQFDRQKTSTGERPVSDPVSHPQQIAGAGR